MAASMMQRCLAVLWSVLTIGLAVTGAHAQPTVTITMRLAEAEWQVVRQEVLPRFEAVCNCRVRAIDVPPETLVQRLRAMHQAGRMEIDLFAQDNMRLQELIDTALAAPFTPEESQVEEANYPSLMAVGVSGEVRYFLPNLSHAAHGMRGVGQKPPACSRWSADASPRFARARTACVSTWFVSRVR